MTSFDKTSITCTQTDKTVTADILEKSDKSMKVAVVGTNLVIYLKREDINKVYIGNYKNLEFTSCGEISL